MINKNKRTWKLFCVFFVFLLLLVGFTANNVINVLAKAPPQTLDISNDRVWVQEGDLGGYTSSTYQIRLINYDEKNNSATYKIGCYWTIEGTVKLYSDNLYVNDQYIGTYSSNNGVHSAGWTTVSRTEWFNVTLKGGANKIKTTNVDGIGGDMNKMIWVDQIGNNPVVHGTNGTWYSGEVASGKRTWQSLYTDGATGSAEGNKVQTSTGFMYTDADEQITPVNAYQSGITISDNSAIVDVKNSSGQVVSWTELNNVGTYTVTSTTKDSSGLTATGTRTIRVVNGSYTVNYNGNGATSGSTATQKPTLENWFNLSTNGFKRQYTVSFNGNGGTPSTSSSVANASFLGWMDNNSYNGHNYYTFNAPYYANYYGDLMNAFGYNKKALFEHFVGSTVKGGETRKSSSHFEIGYYMRYGGQDLINAFGNNKEAFVNHWNLNGYREGRKGTATIDTSSKRDYPNQARVNNLGVSGSTVTLTADWKLGSIKLPSANRPGYTIVGWKNSTGKEIGKVGDIYTPSKNETLIAIWKVNTYSISYDLKGGTLGSQTNPTTYNVGTATFTLKNPTRTGYTFTGWTGSNGSTPKTSVSIAKGSTGNKSYTANWKINTYTNSIFHYITGFKNGEGNADGTGINTGVLKYFNTNSSFNKNYGSKYTLSSSNALVIPKGFQLQSTNVGSSHEGSWKYTYSLPLSITQSNRGFGINYKYNPIQYSITYDLKGGTLGSQTNPSAYNVLYGTTFKNPVRIGYKFKGWKDETGKIVTGINTGVKNSFKTSTWSQVVAEMNKRTSGNKSITATWDKIPTINAKDKVIYEGEFTKEQWLIERLKDVSASDLEDGDITSKIKVIEDTTVVNKPGTYKIIYQVTDSFNNTVKKEVKVTVLFNNPPTISSEDRYFYASEDITTSMLLERVKAFDIEDGDITNKAIIKSSNVESGIVGTYDITYEVTDQHGKPAQSKSKIYVIDDVLESEKSNSYLRFISSKYIDTLKPHSIWRTEEYNVLLTHTLNKTENSQAKEHWKLTVDDINKIKQFNSTHGWSKESNQLFLQEFGNLRK